MASDFTTFDPSTLSRPDQYKLLTGAVVPRPIALVTTIGPDGVNAGAFSFFNAVAADPSMLMFSVGRRGGAIKDTVRNILETKEFVVHIVDVAGREKMNICGTDYSPDVDEVAESGFATAPSVKVRPPRLIECPIQLECRLDRVVALGHYDMVIGEVVLFHFRSDVIDEERKYTDAAKIDPIGRLSGPAYSRVTEQIIMPRLTPPPGKAAATS